MSNTTKHHVTLTSELELNHKKNLSSLSYYKLAKKYNTKISNTPKYRVASELELNHKQNINKKESK